jgi:hypothetical protein
MQAIAAMLQPISQTLMAIPILLSIRKPKAIELVPSHDVEQNLLYLPSIGMLFDQVQTTTCVIAVHRKTLGPLLTSHHQQRILTRASS